jgi:hypothetical protein
VPRVPRLILACAFALAAALLPAADAAAAGWLPQAVAPKANAGNGVGSPQVAVDDAGNVYAVWIESNFVEVSKRPVGGAWEQPQTLDPTGTSSHPDIAVDGAGNAVVVWTETAVGAGNPVIRQAHRAAGAAAFATPVDVPTVPGPGSNDFPKLGVNRAGDAVLAIRTAGNTEQFTRVFLATSTTNFSSFTDYDGTNFFVNAPDVAINEAGDAVVAWTGTISSSSFVHGAYRARGGTFGSNQTVISGGLPAPQDVRVAIDSQGAATAIWDEQSNNQIAASSRASGAGGGWSRLPNPNAAQANSGSPDLDFDADRSTIAAWAAGGALDTSFRPTGGVFNGSPTPLTDSTEDPGGTVLDAGVTGLSALLWDGLPGSQTFSVLRAAVRPNAGSFGPVATLTVSGHGGDSPDVAVDPRGNAAAVWVDTNPPDANPQIVTAEYDATAPSLTNAQVPATGTTGQPVAMSATASDDWSTPLIGWDFGDGRIGFGPTVSHTYDSPGDYAVKATAIDAAGNTTVFNGTVTVSDLVVDPPTRGVDFNASSVSGKVLVSVPKNAPAGRVLARRPVARAAAAITPPSGYLPFRTLGKDDNIPVGSILDATRGISSITMASNRGGTTTQKGQFSLGVFITKQTKASPLTTADMLGGGNFKRDCRKPKARAGSAGVTAARRRPSRRLFANVKGRFRTRGRHSTATVRGTKYLVKDSCSGTTTKVVQGSVVVRDLAKRKNHIVKAGHRYVARPLVRRRRH